MRKAAQIDLPPISSCARCGYALRGNRVTTRCPDCGLGYSLQDCTLHIVGSPGLASRGSLIQLGATFIVFYWFDRLVMFTVMIILLVVLALIRNLVFTWHGWGDVALREDGIVCYRSNREVRRIPWNDVRDIRLEGWNQRGWALVIRTNSSRWKHVFPCGKNKDDAGELLRGAKVLWTAGKANAK